MPLKPEAPESVRLMMSGMYGLTGRSQRPLRLPRPAVLLGRKQLEKMLQGAEVRYSAVYMDLWG